MPTNRTQTRFATATDQTQHSSHNSQQSVKIIIEFNKLVRSLTWIPIPVCFPHIFNCCPGLWHKVANLTSSINAQSDAWVNTISGLYTGSDCNCDGDCDCGVSSSIHPALNYVFISFAVNRKLRHTHGSQVNKWPPFHYCHLPLSLSHTHTVFLTHTPWASCRN